MMIQQISPKAYNKGVYQQSNVISKQNVAFEGKSKIAKVLEYDVQKVIDKHTLALEKSIARGMGKLTDTESFKKLVTAVNKKDHLVSEEKGLLFPHLIVIGSTVLSAFYVGKTLTNKSLEEDKRKTLAINQGLVYAMSTILAYTLDISVNKEFKKMLSRFESVNKIKYPEMKEANLKKLTTGFKMAKSMIAIDLVYRFIAPVLVTPFANSIGNKLKENKEAKLALASNQKMDKVG